MEVLEVVKKIEDIQKSMDNFATAEKVDALAKAFTDFQSAKEAAARKERKNKMFGTEANFDLVAGVMAKELQRLGKVEKGQPGSEFWMERAAALNSTDTNHGPEFLPIAIAPVVNKVITEYGLARPNCRVVNGVHGTIGIKRRLTRVTVSGQTRPDSAPTDAGSTYDSVSLSTKQVSAITTVEEKLIWDSPIDMVNEAMSDLAEAVSQFEDDTLFSGDGSASYLGFTGLKSVTLTGPNSGVVSTTAAGGISVDNVLALQPCVHQSVIRRGNAKFFVHPYIWANLQTKKDSQNRYYFDLQSNNFMIGGTPLVFANSMDSTIAVGKVPVVYGDLERSVTIGLGREMDMRLLTERYADVNEVGVRLSYDIGMVLVRSNLVARIALT